MAEPILDPDYWKLRLNSVRENGQPEHHAIYKVGDAESWERIERCHRGILNKHIHYSDDILDVGCGWGRLVSLLPPNWLGNYLGIDISPDFIQEARRRNPDLDFAVANVEDVDKINTHRYDWAIMISFKKMVIGNLGGEVWDRYEKVLKQVANKILVLEYSELDKGEIL